MGLCKHEASWQRSKDVTKGSEAKLGVYGGPGDSDSDWRVAIGPGCFAFDKYDNADHLVVYWSWIDLSEPTNEMIRKEWSDRIK